ncbi:MAG: hypothetical protein GXZ15_00805 [Campylobacter sp.]|nr:hypothetical protein [Campylobacter sp.]
MKRYFTFLKSSILTIFVIFVIFGCKSNTLAPQVSTFDDNFDIYKFSGPWYEIASTKKESLSNVTVNFAINGREIEIVKSYTSQDKIRNKKEYRARFTADANQSLLEIRARMSFIYKPFNIVRNDNYRYAMIYFADDDISILSRTETLPEVVKVIYLQKVETDGYDTSRLSWKD